MRQHSPPGFMQSRALSIPRNTNVSSRSSEFRGNGEIADANESESSELQIHPPEDNRINVDRVTSRLSLQAIFSAALFRGARIFRRKFFFYGDRVIVYIYIRFSGGFVCLSAAGKYDGQAGVKFHSAGACYSRVILCCCRLDVKGRRAGARGWQGYLVFLVQ